MCIVCRYLHKYVCIPMYVLYVMYITFGGKFLMMVINNF